MGQVCAAAQENSRYARAGAPGLPGQPIPSMLLLTEPDAACFPGGSGWTFDNPLLRLCLEDQLRENERYICTSCAQSPSVPPAIIAAGLVPPEVFVKAALELIVQ